MAKTKIVDLIDVELFRCEGQIVDLVKCLHDLGARVIISNHDFQSTPPKDELVQRLHRMQHVGGDLLKIAVMPNNTNDVIELLSATNQMAGEAETPLVTMSMGGLGAISRITGEVFNSSLTFGTVGKSSAPGQIPIEQLKQCLEIVHASLSISLQ